VILLKYDVELHYDKRTLVLPEQRSVHLSPGQFKCVRALLEAAPHAVPFKTLFELLWGTDNMYMRRRAKITGIGTIVSVTRAKLDNANRYRFILTRRGYGFAWNAETSFEKTPLRL
jgi:DNA-binding response OmpR family regulator